MTTPQHVLVINCGSSSVKYQVVDASSGTAAIKGKIERIGEDGRTHTEAIAEVLEATKDHAIQAVGHRVVHGGERFQSAALIDDDVEAAIEGLIPLAPLHNPANLAGIKAARKALPNLPQVAVFDTAFHARLPRRAKTYALASDAGDYRRYGFHGTSHNYVAQRAAEYLQSDLRDLRIITLHLGGGCSACAIEGGASIETSMGMTPLEGLVMGTRSGDLDPSVVLDLARKHGIDEAEHLLNRKSGLAGLSGIGADLRDILEAAAEGNEDARLAIGVFAHRARKYLGAYAAVLGGVDAVVLTGGIGENSPTMRHRILQRLDVMGLRLDEARNQEAKVSQDAPVFEVSSERSRVRALVVATNEELQIARETAHVAAGLTEVQSPKPIPIAVSGRHVHLTQEALEILFGPGAELTEHKPLSQPGQFASQQKVSLIGPRNRIDGVRILGPVRPKCQVEVSRTDEFRLGVDAPVRRSGHVEGSAPITLEGPAGRLHLEEGLICAWRHIHMTTADAEAYGVSNGDYVEVAVTGGPRDLIFGDVMVRVKDSYRLEMHIDTDEANAAELSRGAEGDLIYAPADCCEATLRSRR